MCSFLKSHQEHCRNSKEHIQEEGGEEFFLAGVGANKYCASTKSRTLFLMAQGINMATRQCEASPCSIL